MAPQSVQADGRGRPAKAPVIVSIAAGLDGGLVEAAAVSAEAAESFAQDAPTPALVHDPVVSGIFVVIQRGYEVSYLIADDGRVQLLHDVKVVRHGLAQRQVLIKPPERLDRVDDALFI